MEASFFSFKFLYFYISPNQLLYENPIRCSLPAPYLFV